MECEVSLVSQNSVFHSILCIVVLLHRVHFYMDLLVMYSNLKNSYSPRIFELETLYFMLSV